MRARRIWRTALRAVALLWAGMVLGVAFIAVPAQFAAEGLERAVGIDVTRHVFARFGRVELGLAAVTLLLALLLRSGRRLLWSLLALLWLIVALQSLWLLPVLDLRADQLLAGEEPPPGRWHSLFVMTEVIKICALLALAWMASRQAFRS